MTGNVFTAQDTGAWFRWIVITPRGPGHFISGLAVTSNVFRTRNGDIDRVEMVDTTHATLAFNSFRNVTFEANTFNGVVQPTASPVMVQHTQNTAADTWVIDASAYLPFGARARNVMGLVAEGPISNAANVNQYIMPYVLVEQGINQAFAHVKWQTAVKGRVQATIRCDNPV